MIVEFLGISGSGKSFVATQYCHFLNDRGISYIWPWKRLYAKSYVQRNLKKSFSVGMKMISSPRWCLKLFRYLLHQGINGKRDLPVLFFNGIYLCHALEKYSGFEGVALFDEGIAQYLWAIHYRNGKDITEEEFEEVKALFKLPSILYVVTAKSETILKRMVARNVRDEIRERGDVMTELEIGQKTVIMVSHVLSLKMCGRVISIDNNANEASKESNTFNFT